MNRPPNIKHLNIFPHCLDVKESKIQRRHVFSGYGIPTEMIPITDTGNVKHTFLRQWIKLRTLLERKDHFGSSGTLHDPGKIVEFPGSSDVLYRTGTTTKCHPGNAAFRELIESKIENGKIFSEISLSMLAEALIKEFLEIRPGRFLKWDNRGYWVVLNDRAQINVKVAATIRDFNRWKSVKNDLQILDSSKGTSEGEEDVKRRRMSSDGDER